MQKIIHEYKNLNILFDYLDSLYYETSNVDSKSKKSLIRKCYPSTMKSLIAMFSDYGYEFDFDFKDMTFEPLDFPKGSNNSVIVCVSGGKDSLATVLHYLDKGYDVRLYHIIGINKCYPDEWERVQEIADYLKVPVYFDKIKLSGNHMYVEHPLKNFMLINGAIHYAVSIGIGNIAMGDFSTASLAENTFEVSGGDCKEVWQEYYKIIRDIIPDFVIQMPLESVTNTLARFENDKKLLELSQSCMGTFRFREYKRQQHIKKYGVQLMPHRCGSCWKCALEYIYYCDNDLLEFNEGYYKHCFDVLLNDMRHNGLIPYTVEYIWDNFLYYDIRKSKIYEDLSHAIVQSRKVKYNSEEIAREIPSATVFSDK